MPRPLGRGGVYWLFLHTPLKVKEHHHHHLDIFPDSGRILPFGSGSGVLYNYGDLQFKNQTKHTFYLKIWVDKTFLHGEIYTIDSDFPLTYKIIERDHKFYTKNNKVYRTNKIFRLTRERMGGKLVKEELITNNDSEVLYEITEEKIFELNAFYEEKEKETNRIASQTN